MKIGIMQPYFLPYIGYFQLIAAVDVFVVYDNIQYSKKGWINRNRFLLNGTDAVFSLPLQKASDYLDVRERQLAESYDRDKLLDRLKGAYRRAPYFENTMPLLERVIRYEDGDLFGYVYHSLLQTCAHLGIDTEIRVSSTVDADHSLKGQDRVIALNQALHATVYRNPGGGVDLYSKSDFRQRGIELQFVRSLPIEYPQLDNPFVPWLSIVDVLMFNSIDEIKNNLLPKIELV